MADRYLVATGNWNDTASWSAASGGAAGASFPVAGDNVFCDAASGAVTLTVNTSSACADLNFTGFTGTFTGSSALAIGGSLTLAAGMTRSYTGAITFNATATGKTITSNGKALFSAITFNGVGGGWTLGDALNNGTQTITLTAGAFSSGGFAITASAFTSSGAATRSLDLSGTTWTSTSGGAWNVSASLSLTVNTSTLLTGFATSCNFGTLTYNDVTFPANSTVTIAGGGTFRNITSSSGNGGLSLSDNITATGTLTLAGGSASSRMFIQSSAAGTTRTITAAVVSLTDVDFQDITGAGAASPFTGTRLGDCKGNSGITFTAAANKYWVGNTANWNSTSWATSSGGAAGANNFPLAQDACVFDANSFSADSQAVTINGAFRIGSVDFTAIDQASIAFQDSGGATYFGNVTFKSGMTYTGGVTNTFAGRGTQVLTTAGVAFRNPLTIDSPGGTLQLGDALTMTAPGSTLTLTRGTFDMNAKAASIVAFSSSNSNTRAITSGGATLTLTGNGATILSAATLTGLTLNDALTVDCTYSGSTSIRTISWGSSAGGTETTAVSLNVSAGSDQVTFSANSAIKDVDFTGFSGTLSNLSVRIFGDLTLSAAMTLSSVATTTTFAATSGTKTITTNGKTIDQPVTFSGAGGTWQLAGDMTMGSTRTTTLTAGTVDLNGNTLTTGRFSSTGATARAISTTAGGVLATSDTTATTVFTGSGSNFTIDADLSIEIGGNTTNTRTFAGGGLTYPSLTFTNTTANGRLDFTGANTIGDLAVSNPPQSLMFTAGTTTTITGTFPSGTLLGGDVTIGSITAASHTLSYGGTIGGRLSMDYLSISRSTATPATTWFAGQNSTDGGNNSGWEFRDPPQRDHWMGFMLGGWAAIAPLAGLLALALLAGCAGQAPMEKAVTLTLTDDVEASCPSFFERDGCAKTNGSSCEIVARRPRSFDDRDRLTTLGHELWHCFNGPTHQ
jgi:fibronectin-binding autotransporter adhesin